MNSARDATTSEQLGYAPAMAPTRNDIAGRFEQLAMPHRNAAFNLAYWMLRNREEAEDVVQDAYLRAFRAFSSFKGEAIKAWLLVIVRNTAYSALMARKRNGDLILLADDVKPRKDGAVHEAACAGTSPEALVIAESERWQLLAALAQGP